MIPVQCASKTNFSVKASQVSSQNQNSVQRRQVRGVDVCHQICVAMAQTNGGQPQVTNNLTFAISWVHTIRTSVLHVSDTAVVLTHCLCGMLAQHKAQCTWSALLYSVLVNTCTHCMQAAAQQTQEAQPNAHNAESARHWIAAWRSKVAMQLTACNANLDYIPDPCCMQPAGTKCKSIRCQLKWRQAEWVNTSQSGRASDSPQAARGSSAKGETQKSTCQGLQQCQQV